MSSEKLIPDRPSQLYDQIKEALIFKFGDELDVKGYEDVSPEIDKSTFLIEFERGTGHELNHKGQYGHCYFVAVHVLISNGHKRAALAAMNVCADVERLVHYNSFGIDTDSINKPEDVTSEPSMFSKGEGGYEGWTVSWKQTLYLGETEEEEPRQGIRWAINPQNDEDPGEYHPIPD
ncbi:hypothetical protein EYS14_03370 [Alteromonadaceae bacterium M269]|nr:hypothetical protein EYS14_03370 [Alteromonadaceae bacterium M269]